MKTVCKFISDLSILPNQWITLTLKRKDQNKSIKTPQATIIEKVIKPINLI